MFELNMTVYCVFYRRYVDECQKDLKKLTERCHISYEPPAPSPAVTSQLSDVEAVKRKLFDIGT